LKRACAAEFSETFPCTRLDLRCPPPLVLVPVVVVVVGCEKLVLVVAGACGVRDVPLR